MILIALIEHTVPDEIRCQSVDTLKVRKEVLAYLHKNKFITIEDIIKRQDKIPKKHRGAIYAYLIFGITSD